jgi:two-component system osmolarity sensor histidine kinase EnvZ
MILAWLRKRLPRSLMARVAIILLLPAVLLQLAVSIAFVQRAYDDVTRQMTRSLLLELRFLSVATDAAPDAPSALAYATAAAAPLELSVRLPAEAPAAVRVPVWDLPGRTVAQTLREGLPRLEAVDLRVAGRVAIWLGTQHGPMRVEFDRARVTAANPHWLLLGMIVFGGLLAVLAYRIMRRQLRPVLDLAAAATAYGRGRIVPFRPGGAAEVRAAGTAFVEMRHRLERQAQARTAMLAGISHDLRTPLTRLRLGLAMIDDAEAAHLRRDAEDMTRMIDVFLDFARGDAGDPQEATALAPLVEEVAQSFRRGGDKVEVARIQGKDPGLVPLRPLAIRRALQNLLANALAHGTRARVTLAFGARTIRLSVEDDGPGIPRERREEAMRPFTRLDAARNQDRPGVGLGLAIVADIARTHGGQLRLGRSEALGGLRADLVIAR